MNISFPSKRVVLLWLPLLFFSCTKQQGLTIFTVSVEPSAAAKMTVADTLSFWQEGDNIWVNGSTGSVAFTDAHSPTVSFQDEAVPNWEDNYYAAFPAGICSSGTTAGTLSVTLPAVYQYSQASDGKQQLPMPMVAHSTGSHLLFRHLTAALIVKIPAVSDNVVLDYVAVRSSVSALSGNATVDASSDTPQPTFVSDTSHTVTLLFDNAQLFLDDSRKVMLPIPQVPDGNKFTVTVLAHTTGDSPVYYLFNQEQSTGGALFRNTIAYAPVPSLPQSNGVPLVGSGTESSPYLIHNHVDYRTFLDNIQNGTNTFRSACFKMMADADFQGSTVQSSTEYFSGHFDGNGHAIKNATVTARYLNPNYYLSIFPPISGGEIKDLTVENVTLDFRSGITGSSPIYCGGLTSYVVIDGSSASMKNIMVSNLTVINPLYVDGVYSHDVSFGGIVGRTMKQQGTDVFLEMTNCDFSLPNKHLELDVHVCSKFYYGAFVAYVEGVYVKMEDCNLSVFGSASDYGVSIIAGSTPSYVGAAFGVVTTGSYLYATQVGCSLSGYMLYTGTNSNNLKKILGFKGSSAHMSGSIDHTNLHFYQRNSSTSTATPVTTPGT